MWFIQYEHIIEERDKNRSLDIDLCGSPREYERDLEAMPWVETSRTLRNSTNNKTPSEYYQQLRNTHFDSPYKRHTFKFTFAVKE